jgi:hypothetical protein
MCENVNINVSETNETINIVSSEIQEVIDINVFETTEDVTLNITEEIIQVNINKVTGGEQIQSDWNQTNVDALDFIKNKPTSTSDFINDGEDGVNPFITAADVTPQVNSDWDATSGVAEILNKPIIPTATSDLTNDGSDGINPFITAADIPPVTGFVPYTGATANVDLGTHTLSAKDLVINHSSGSGVAASITKGGAGEALTINKTSGSGNAMSVTGGVTQLDELHLTTDLADAYIASAATWNGKFTLPALTSGSVLFSNGTTIAQNNANLFWDDTNNRLGIGTNSPTAKLDLVSGSDTIGIKLRGKNLDNISNLIFSSSDGVSQFGYIQQRSNSMRIATNVGPIQFWNGPDLASISQKAILFTTGNLAINTTTDAGFKLDVNGTARVSGQINCSNIFADRVIQLGASSTNTNTSAFSNSTTFPRFSQNNSVNRIFYDNGIYNPTSGTGTYSAFETIVNINQTGGANGITRGLYINPTLTSAADFRAIEVANGITILGASTTAKASLRIPSGTAPTSPVNGDIWFDGTNLNVRIGGVTRTIVVL